MSGHGSYYSPRPIERVAEHVAFSNAFGTLYDDSVVAPDGMPGRYLRWRWAVERGVVVVAVHAGGVAFCPMYRYPVGGVSLEFPRGGAGPDESVEAAALRELREETGLIGASPKRVGELYAETGLIATPITVVAVSVAVERAGPTALESMESVSAAIRWQPLAALDTLLREGTVRCGITIAAAALYRGAI